MVKVSEGQGQVQTPKPAPRHNNVSLMHPVLDRLPRRLELFFQSDLPQALIQVFSGRGRRIVLWIIGRYAALQDI
jgi:hypothetical protein